MSEWRDRNKFRLQVGALIVLLAAPFALYAALGVRQVALAAAVFAAIALSLAVVVWIG